MSEETAICWCCKRELPVDQVADTFRRKHLERNGIDPATALPFEDLKESEQEQWRTVARETMRGPS